MLLIIDDDKACLKIMPFDPACSRLLPSLTGEKAWLKGGQGMLVEATDGNLSTLRSFYPDIKVLDRRILASPSWEEAVERPIYTPRTAPRAYQKEALVKLGTKPRFALFMEVGSGKTKVAIDYAGQEFCAGRISGVIVIAPLGVHRQWADAQFPIHSGVAFSSYVWPLKGFDKAMGPGETLKIVFINWDGMKTTKGFALLESFIKKHQGKVLLIADESHNMKNYRSERHKVADALGRAVSHKLMLTGTPNARDLTDEWAQFRWLDPSIIGIKYITHFRNEYCIMGGFENRQVVGHRNIERFKQKIEPFVFRVTKKEIGQLPANKDFWYFNLDANQKKQIKEIRKELQLSLDSGTFEVANAAVAVNKAQQISNGFILDSGFVHALYPSWEKNPRMVALKSFLDSREGEKIIIWVRYIADAKMIVEMIGNEKCALYIGETSVSDRQKAISNFIDEPGKQYFVANPAAAGTGIDGLQMACCTDIFYSMNDNFIQKEQAEGRIDRIGSKGIVSHFYLIGKGSFDSKIIIRHNKKRMITEMVHGDWKEFLSESEETPIQLIGDASTWES